MTRIWRPDGDSITTPAQLAVDVARMDTPARARAGRGRLTKGEAAGSR
jgi:hypothetical protein